jgi:hypothetical protein
MNKPKRKPLDSTQNADDLFGDITDLTRISASNDAKRNVFSQDYDFRNKSEVTIRESEDKAIESEVKEEIKRNEESIESYTIETSGNETLVEKSPSSVKGE